MVEVCFLSSLWRAWGTSELEIVSGLFILQYQWLTFSRSPMANLSVIDSAVATSAARESIRSNDCLVSPPNCSNVQSSSVRALYAAFNFASPRLRSSSSIRDIEYTKRISRCCCYHQAGVCVPCEPTLAAARCGVGRECGVH